MCLEHINLKDWVKLACKCVTLIKNSRRVLHLSSWNGVIHFLQSKNAFKRFNFTRKIHQLFDNPQFAIIPK